MSNDTGRGVERQPDRFLRETQVSIERKRFTFTMKENRSGAFLRITEEVGGRRDTIVVPATGLDEFAKALDDIRLKL